MSFLKHFKKIIFTIILANVFLFCNFSHAETQQELKEMFVTREEWENWLDTLLINFNQLDQSIYDMLSNEIRFQMWARNVKDETDPVVYDKQIEQYTMKLNAIKAGQGSNIFPVTFVMNGGTWKTRQTLMYYRGDIENQLPDEQDVYNSGKAFVGWYDNINLEGGVVTSIPANTYKPTIYFAKWRNLNPGEDPADYSGKIKLIYHLNSGNWSSGYTPVVYYKQDEGMSLPNSSQVVMPGYNFDGWYKTDACNPSDKLTSIADHIDPAIKDVYAKWNEATYHITYNLGGASWNSYTPTEELLYTQTLPLPDESKLTYADHIFKGWYDNSQFTGSPVTNIPANIPNDKIYYARWVQTNYSLTFIKNGGSFVETEPTQRPYLSVYNLPTAADISKAGNTFAGWYDNSSYLGTQVTSIPANTEGNKTFYAKWTENTYTMVYHLDNGSTTESLPSTRKYSQSVSLPNFDKMSPNSGYKFRGWYADAGHTSLITSVAANSTTTDVYASFVPMNNWGTKGEDGNWNGISYSSWMSKIPDDMYLSEINIPGAHDAGCHEVDAQGIITSIIPAWTDDFAKTQSYGIVGSNTQLEQGVRALDIRLDNNNRLCHGDEHVEKTLGFITVDLNMKYLCKNGSNEITLDNVFDKASSFLHAHPTETIIMLITNESGSGTVANAKATTEACINKYTTGYNGRSNYKGVYSGTTIPKLGDVRGKIVILSDGLGLSNCIDYKNMDGNGDTFDGVTYVFENHYEAKKSDKWNYVKTALDKCTTKINTQINKGSKTSKSGNIWTTSNRAGSVDTDNTPTKVDDYIDPLRRNYGWVQGNAYGIVWMDFVRTYDTNYVIASNP